jgi:probable rRNA maturation factor
MPETIILNRQRKYPIQLPRLKRFLLRLCLCLRISDQPFVVLLTNDRMIRRLNRCFRNKNRATDVLSFPCGMSCSPKPGFERDYLGDIIISVERARHQALEREHGLDREIRILMIHGLLHLLGHDHETDHGQMRRKELKLQRELL